MTNSRRNFLKFLGRAAIGSKVAVSSNVFSATLHPNLPFDPILPSTVDDIVLAKGYSYQRLITAGTLINKKGERFGEFNDFLHIHYDNPKNPDQALLWVNHEYFNERFLGTRKQKSEPKTKAAVDLERTVIGGSILRVKKNKKSKKWEVDINDPVNRRIDGNTEIPIISQRPLINGTTARGTFGNCAGGYTPWGTVLTCEENYQDYYGEVSFHEVTGERIWNKKSSYGWAEFYEEPPEHYGWVVEVNLATGAAKKLTGLGRFAHEGATTTRAADGRMVVYQGDDANDQCIYKFISKSKDSLEEGDLYVAKLSETGSGTWELLDLSNAKLSAKFKDKSAMLIRTREAAAIMEGTPLARPEDIEIDPVTKSVVIALTNNEKKGNLHGSLLRIDESNRDPGSLTFTHQEFKAGGPQTGFSCPDNLCFDHQGNLWMTSDISSKRMRKGEHQIFGNNGLFYIPMTGSNAGRVFQFASAPVDAEFTGPCFSEDGSTLFLSVQHPGEGTEDLTQPTSRWPMGGKNLPKSAVVTIDIPFLRKKST